MELHENLRTCADLRTLYKGKKMQHDDLVWDVIGNSKFCAYKVKPPAASSNQQRFCRNPYNLSGLCNRMTCPLANSRYATVLEEEGVLYLYIKTAERAHSPKNLWEKVKLPQNFAQALKVVDKHLLFWPQLYINKCKQRVTRINQYLIRMRKLKLKVQPKIVGRIKKVERRETNREAKALKAAKLTEEIKNELLERLHQGTYGDIYNFPQKEYDEVLDIEDQEELEDEAEEEQVTEKFSEKKEIEVEKKPREEMNGILVYDSYAKLTGNTKIV
jgi:protein MAK16